MTQRQTDAALRARTRLPEARLRAIAEEAAVHAEVGLAMAGLDDGYEACVEATPSHHECGGLQVRLYDAEGDALCVTLAVSPAGLVRAQDEDMETAWGRTPWRRPGEIGLVAADAARLLRATVSAPTLC